MVNERLDHHLVFVVGAPRSGTTLLGDMLACHPRIRQWYEPYFVWDRHFRNAAHDERGAADATPPVKRYIRSHCARFRRRSGADLIVDKSPRNSLRIPFIQAVFPRARIIHILRDGRDVTLSIHRKWRQFEALDQARRAGSAGDRRAAVNLLREWLWKQPFWTDRLRALWFETGGHLFDRSRHLRRRRWNGRPGMGPRYRGWQRDLVRYSTLQFNALQWVHCVNAVRCDWSRITPAHRFEIRYEALLQAPARWWARLIEFLGADPRDARCEPLPPIRSRNVAKWRNGLDASQIATLEPLLTPSLRENGYLDGTTW